MDSRFNIRVLAAALTVLLAAQGLQAKSLIENSPFIPEGWTPPAPPTPSSNLNMGQKAAYELRGIESSGGRQSFYVFDRNANRGFWVAQGDLKPNIMVKRYDAGEQTLTVVINGREEKLSIAKPDMKPVAIKTITPTTVTATPTPQAGQPGQPQGVPAPTQPQAQQQSPQPSQPQVQQPRRRSITR